MASSTQRNRAVFVVQFQLVLHDFPFSLLSYIQKACDEQSDFVNDRKATCFSKTAVLVIFIICYYYDHCYHFNDVDNCSFMTRFSLTMLINVAL